jgi:Protein of unknown function (DUF3667)
MLPADCLNCGAALQSHQKYCPLCGQKANIPRITMRQLLRDFLQTITHADKGLLKLIKGLAINPGKTASEYVEGRRKTYFSPFGFLAVCIAFMLFMNKWIKPYGDLPVADAEVLARMPDEYIRHQYLLSMERMARVQDFSNKNMNIVSILVTPYFAFFLWLFFRHRGRNMGEITITYLLFTGFSNAVSSVLFAPWMAMHRNTSVTYYFIFWGSMLLQTMYFAWGLKVFFNYKTTSGYMKVLGALLLIGFIGFILLFIGLFIYVYRGETFKVLQYL